MPKIMNTKQTITIIRATGQQLFVLLLLRSSASGPTTSRSTGGFILIFCSCQNSQVFRLPVIANPPKAGHLIEFDGFTLIGAAAAPAPVPPAAAATPAAPFLPQPTNPATIFIAFYIIVLAVWHTLLILPVPSSIFCSASASAYSQHISASIFMCSAFIMLYFFAPLFNPLFLCDVRRCCCCS